MPMIRTICGLTLLTLAAQPLQAQAISGRVVEGRTGRPVPHAMVTVTDATGKPAGYSQSDGTGEYRIALRAAGRYTIRAERMGYRPTSSGLTQVREDRDVHRDLRMTRGSSRLGQEAERGLLPPAAVPRPLPGSPPSTDAGPSTSRAPAGAATAVRPVPRTAPVAQPRRGETARQPHPSSRRASGGNRGGARRTP
jgi:hypothetical protein